MTGMEGVLEGGRRLVTPSDAEKARVRKLAEMALSRTKLAASSYPEVQDVVIGGSFAKGTWLPGEADIDIFVKLDPQTPTTKFESAGLAIGSQAMRGYPKGKKYAQHPYTEATFEGVKVNIVPCFDVVAKSWISAADRSPFHVEAVRSIPEEQKTQVRLLKKFMKGIGAYGAEIETQGFSGYVAEVMVMQGGTFLEVLKQVSGRPLHSAERPFSLPDPVDPSRDLGIAVSGEKFGRFVLASRAFLRKPHRAYFGKMTGRARAPIKESVIAVVFQHPRLSEDTLWGELRRTIKHMVRHLEVQGFKIARSMAASNDVDASAFLFIPEFTSLPSLEQRVGPTVDLRKETESFISSNRRRARLVWVDDDARVRLLKEREHTDIVGLLEDIARGRAGPVGASDEVARAMAKKAKVVTRVQLSKLAKSEKWLAIGVRDITSDAIGTRGD